MEIVATMMPERNSIIFAIILNYLNFELRALNLWLVFDLVFGLCTTPRFAGIA